MNPSKMNFEQRKQALGYEPPMTARDAAYYLGVHVVTIRRLAEKRKIPITGRVGLEYRFRKSSLDRWMDANKETASKSIRKAQGKKRRNATGSSNPAIRPTLAATPDKIVRRRQNLREVSE